jgi:sugar lactone lactonase YvrE
MRTRPVAVTAAISGLALVAAVVPAAGAPGLPHQAAQIAVAANDLGALSNVTHVHANGSLAVTDANGAERIATNGDVIYAATGSGAPNDLIVDNHGIGYATFTGDHAVRVLAPDGSLLRTYDLSFIDPNIQPTSLTLDAGAPDYFSPRQLYVQTTADGMIVLDPDAAAVDFSNAGFVNQLGGGILAVAPDHSFYWTSGSDDRVLHLTDEGIRMSSFVVPGNADTPATVTLTSLAIDSAGYLFAGDGPNHRIVELTLKGDVLDQFGQANPYAPDVPTASTAGALDGPGPMAIDCHGGLWVADTDSSGNSRLLEFTRVAAPTGACAPPPAPATVGPSSPQASLPAVDRAGNVYLSAAGGVEKFDASRHFVLRWGTTHPVEPASGPPANGVFGLASGIGADPVTGDVWVVSYRWPDYDANGTLVNVHNGFAQLLRFGPTGAFEARITTPTGGGSAFATPTAMTIRRSDGHVFVADTTLQTVQELTRTGAFVRSYSIPTFVGAEASGGLPFVFALAFDPQGRLLVSARQRQSHVSSPTGTNSTYVGFIVRYLTSGPSLGSPENLFPVPQNLATKGDAPGSIAVLPNGSMLWSSSPNLPVVSTSASAAVLTVSSTYAPTGQVFADVLSPSGTARLAGDCAGNVVAADPGNGRYVSLRYNAGRCIWLPTATTGVMTRRTATTLTVTASANPSAQVTKMRVLYGPTTKYGKATAWITLPSDNVVHTKSVAIAGLLPAHVYHYRVQVQNASGTVTGIDRSASTL